MSPENRDADPVPESDGLDFSVFEAAFDAVGVDKIKRDAQAPAGQYTSTPALTAQVFKDDDGRRVVLYSGWFTHDESGTGHRLRLRVSPDRRDRKDDSGKPDLSSQLWSQASDAFKAATGVDPTTERQVLEYLANYPVKVRVVQGDESPFVVRLRAVMA